MAEAVYPTKAILNGGNAAHERRHVTYWSAVDLHAAAALGEWQAVRHHAQFTMGRSFGYTPSHIVIRWPNRLSRHTAGSSPNTPVPEDTQQDLQKGGVARVDSRLKQRRHSPFSSLCESDF